jgi:hypothetical protein
MIEETQVVFHKANEPSTEIGDPIADAVTPTATPAEADELRRLVNAILAGDTEADRAEAFAIALADPVAALTCYRTLCPGIAREQRDDKE